MSEVVRRVQSPLPPPLRKGLAATRLIQTRRIYSVTTGKLPDFPGRHLAWTRQPIFAEPGEPITPAPQVEIRYGTSLDSRIRDGLVTMAIASGPPGAELLGDTSARLVNGVATFPNLRVSHRGGYTLFPECQESSLEFVYDGPGISPYTPGLLALYNGSPSGEIVDALGQWPSFEAKPENRYGSPTPIGPIGLYDSTINHNGPWMVAPNFWRHGREVFLDNGFTLIALVKSYIDGMFFLYGSRAGQNYLRIELPRTSSNPNTHTPTIHFGGPNSYYTHRLDSIRDLPVAWHVFAFVYTRNAPGVYPTFSFYIDGRLHDFREFQNVGDPGEIEQLSTEIVRGPQEFGQMALFNYPLSGAEIYQHTRNYRVIP